MALARFPISDFKGGWNTRDNPADLEANESPDLLNVSLTAVSGGLTQRAGKTRFDTAGFPANKRAETMRRWLFGSTSLVILSIDGTIYSCDTGGALTSRFAGTAGKTWAFETTQDNAGTDYLWAVNGTDAPRKWVGSGATALWTNPPPTTSSCLKVWKNIMWASGDSAKPQRLYYTTAGNPEATPTWNFIDIRYGDDDIDAITWLDIFEDRLYIFKKNSVSVLLDPVSLANRQLGQPGCEDRFQSAVLSNRLYWFNRRGIFSTNGVTINEDTWPIQPWFYGDAPALQFTAIPAARVFAWDRKIYLAVTSTQSVGGNDTLIEITPSINYRRVGGRSYDVLPAVTRHSLSVASVAPARIAGQDFLIGADSRAAKLHKLFSGTSDDGVAISAYWQSAWRGIQEIEPVERLRRLSFVYSGRFDVDVMRDLQDAVQFSSSLPEAGTGTDSLWDGGVWDGGVWDDASAQTFNRVRPEVRGRYHSIRVRNDNLDKSFTIYKAEMSYRGGKEHTR